MQKPKMILFDYGHTLLYEPGLDFLRGEKALFQYVVKNKNKPLTGGGDRLFGQAL